MNHTLSNILLFTAGAAVGSLVTWRIFKSRYEIVDEDIDEEPDEIENDSEEEGSETVESRTALNKKPPLKEYVQMVNKLSYANAEEAEEEDDDMRDVYEPYIIRPEEYGELHAYETLSLNYYADGVLTDDLDNPIEDVERIVPADYADHFGEYEDDAVFVRNDELECDYEILRDLRKFTDVVGDDPHPSEDE